MSTPSRARFSSASGLCVSSTSESRSVRTRLISSGIVQSPERRPASRWAMGMCSFAAASAQASVELTSPATTTSAGALLEQDALEGDQDLAGLLAVAAGADAQRVVGSREAEILEDLLRHPAVVVLAGVHDHLAGGSAPAQRVDERGHLHEVRPGADDVHDGRWSAMGRGAAARGGVERSRQNKRAGAPAPSETFVQACPASLDLPDRTSVQTNATERLADAASVDRAPCSGVPPGTV